MEFHFLKLLIITIFISSSSCIHESGKTSRSNFTIQTNTIAEIDSPKLLIQSDSNQFFEKQQLESKEKTEDCFFQKITFDLPNISKVVGDTLNIQNIYDWVVSYNPNYDESEIQKIIGQGYKYFRLGKNDLFEIIGFLEDEGEYLSIKFYTIDLVSCRILGNEIIAERSRWENGYKETLSIIEENYTLKKIEKSGSKDWGDGTKWKRDTLNSNIIFEKNGNILIEKL